MNAFMNGFCDEACSVLCRPMPKIAEADPAHASKKILDLVGGEKMKGSARRFGARALGAGVFSQLVNPDATLGSSLGTGAALAGGGLAGDQLAKSLSMGAKGKAGLSILGSALAARMLYKHRRDKKRDKAEARRSAREDLMAEAAAKSLRKTGAPLGIPKGVVAAAKNMSQQAPKPGGLAPLPDWAKPGYGVDKSNRVSADYKPAYRPPAATASSPAPAPQPKAQPKPSSVLDKYGPSFGQSSERLKARNAPKPAKLVGGDPGGTRNTFGGGSTMNVASNTLKL